MGTIWSHDSASVSVLSSLVVVVVLAAATVKTGEMHNTTHQIV